ncbi:MAG: NADPH-dependent 7-cyano-7-deazaguanine reductase QueF [Pseudoalteromonas spongiae]|uniref:NADPH-dependent 7-cyano-7-deazaguanine reductase QueF n=1 Tax=Pseudoalteromonas TaxID=53246 RepID=UPI00026CBB58|nr:NADPH-dependent 7-cyano-7-deazaguanine reductase QueF [Pseudoalteromonas spongiae]ATC98952.1 7-cyano-7-deazaguanine reductase [Pseudoalteromonas spongiae UST010723-006]MEC8326845.1 NADPH-dependent 7-cyano-7-deazaguanine reductase QueF [Pseudomonadota bacterium]TMO87809.1 NADPH-dependent 7-cyano-7-deazaguanine reductase QueF [Pseudoalteromonas spongiae]
MSHYQDAPELKGALLGQQTEYKDSYDASLLFPIARKLNRDDLNIDESALPFKGEDTWTGYELSWLNQKGKPVVAVAEFIFPATSSHIIESKSFKLYLNSFNQTKFDSMAQVQQILTSDLSKSANCDVVVKLFNADDFDCLMPTPFTGTCLDDLDIEVSEYDLNTELLKADASNEIVTETLYSHLLKSNCLITSQPDWASVVIRYTGKKICHESLLKYLISFRNHNEFHEQCVERLFCDIQNKFSMTQLEVFARYTRRGGLDINPYRSTDFATTQFKLKSNRQ